jgi:hypothetical protein
MACADIVVFLYVNCRVELDLKIARFAALQTRYIASQHCTARIVQARPSSLIYDQKIVSAVGK